MVATVCSPSLDVTKQATEKPILMTVTRTPFLPVENILYSPTKRFEVTSTTAMEPTATPASRNLKGLYTVSIQSEFLNKWWKEQFKELEVRSCDDPCTKERIEELLDSHSKWVIAQPNEGRILYTHSGWEAFGPEFGEIFLRLYNSDKLNETSICLNKDLCYKVVDFLVLDRNEIGNEIHIDELFEENEQDDYFILTCSKRVIPGFQTPKLIIQIRKF